MKLNDHLPAVSGAWDCAVLILKNQGLRSALAYADAEVRRMADGGQLEEAHQLTSHLVSLCNKEALLQPCRDSIWVLRTAKALLDFLDRHSTPAPKYFEDSFRMQLLTCNNLAQVLKTSGDTDRAYWYLECADRIARTRIVPQSSDNLQYIASTKVNLSTLLLDLKRFPECIHYAEECLHLLQLRLSLTSLSLQKLAQKDREKHQAMLHSYLSAIFNIAMADEALGRRDAAAKSYHACIAFGKKYVPERNSTLSEAESALNELLRPATDWLKQTQSHATTPDPPERRSCGGMMEDRPKYYSQERLKRLHAVIQAGGRTAFYSSNQHFSVTVRKSLKLDQDVKHLKPVSRGQLTDSLQSESPRGTDHRSVTQLRLRKYKKLTSRPQASQPRGLDYVQGRLVALQQEQYSANSQTVRLSKVSDLRKSETAGIVSARVRKGSETVTPPPSRPSPPGVKAEIEELMSEIQTRIKSLSPSPPRYSRPQPSARYSELAVSARHTPAEKRERCEGKPVTKLMSMLLGTNESAVGTRRVSFVKKEEGSEGEGGRQ